MTSTVTVRHNFETAHRLPHLPGKCQSLHGHSWWVEVTVAGQVDSDGVLVEFGPFKNALREWIDRHLDHGVILGTSDPLVEPLRRHDTKVFVLHTWPTVEEVAKLLATMASLELGRLGYDGDDVAVRQVVVQETHVNAAAWTP